MSSVKPKWQLVVILWGTKYAVSELNALITTIESKAAHPPRVVLISDRERPDISSHVVTRSFPEFYLRSEFYGSGCQAKLAMFASGIVPTDLPAIYVDIDTLILGDITKVLQLLTTPDSVAMLQSVVLPFGTFARAIYYLTGKRRYARGNSSIVVFHPASCAYIAETFERLYAKHGHLGIRPMIADERFISWVAQPQMRAIPKNLAVKFPTEFMWPWRWLVYLRARLPWLQRRWQGLVAVTFPGDEVTGQQLLKLCEGDEIMDRKGRRLIWSDLALGPLRKRIVGYYTDLHKRINLGERT